MMRIFAGKGRGDEYVAYVAELTACAQPDEITFISAGFDPEHGQCIIIRHGQPKPYQEPLPPVMPAEEASRIYGRGRFL